MVEIRTFEELTVRLDDKPASWVFLIRRRLGLRLIASIGTNSRKLVIAYDWRSRLVLKIIRPFVSDFLREAFVRADFDRGIYKHDLGRFEDIISFIEKRFPSSQYVDLKNSVYFASKMAGYEELLSQQELREFYIAIIDEFFWNIRINSEYGDLLHAVSLDATALESGVDLWSQPLWLDDIPEWAAEGWENLATELTKRTPYWKTLVRWYEDRLKGDDWAASQGRPAIRELEIARASLPDSYWKKGGKAVNLAIAELEDFFWNNVPLKDPALKELVGQLGREEDLPVIIPDESQYLVPSTFSDAGVLEHDIEASNGFPSPELPAQSHGAHFGIRDGLISFAPADHLDPARNNIQRLKSLHPLLLAEARSAISIFGRNQAHGRIHDALLSYAGWLDGEVTALDFDVLCGLGTKLQSEEAAAKEAIEDGLEPPFERSEIAALKALLDLHGPFVLATEIGQQFVADAERWQRNPQEEATFRQTATDFAEAVEAEGIATPETAAFVKQAAASAGMGPQPERSAMFGIGTVRNVSIGIIGGAVLSHPSEFIAVASALQSTTILAGGAVVGYAAGTLQTLVTEGVKRSAPGLAIINWTKDSIDAGYNAEPFKKFADFTKVHWREFMALAGTRREFQWLRDWAHWLKSRGEPK